MKERKREPSRKVKGRKNKRMGRRWNYVMPVLAVEQQSNVSV